MIVDANGALVILKFLNQDLTSIQFTNESIIEGLVDVYRAELEESEIGKKELFRERDEAERDKTREAEKERERQLNGIDRDRDEDITSLILRKKEAQQIDHSNTRIYYNLLLQNTICKLLHLIYKLCNSHSERIKTYLVQYKAPLIMKRLYSKFKYFFIKFRALKLLKIQIKYLPKKWREGNLILHFI